MTPIRWARVQELFNTAVELPPERWQAVLDDAAVDDPEIAAQVRELLGAEARAGGFLESALKQAAGDVLASEMPARIGPYAIIRQLGEGGMGRVYLARRDDDEYRKEVAIKLTRSGLDGPSLLRRFRAERQILANLDHPGIARLLDGGATDWGAPYVVMEYVPGVAIDDYCAAQRLPIADRLQLFCEVCRAVGYAHRNLVVHRDIKPANILVTADGTPKLLDFGIAKLLSKDDLIDTRPLTLGPERMMTPEYASPEQIRGEAITTAVDVYALGVLLYELLAGVRPFNFKGVSPTECERIICTSDPPRPSTISGMRQELSGDLDSIVLKALRKEPGRRYASADEFSHDLERYLNGLPVEARPDTWQYRTVKFINRHRTALLVAFTLLVLLIAGIVSTALAERRAEAARALAQQRFQTVLAMANSSLFEVNDAISELPGSTRARALVVRRALGYLDLLAADNNSDPSLQSELAAAYEKLGEIQFREGPGHLGDSTGALASANHALTLRRALLERNRNDRTAMLRVAADLARLGDIERLTRDLNGATRSYQEALALNESVGKRAPRDIDMRRQTAGVYQRLGDVEAVSGSRDAALVHARLAMELRRDLMRDLPRDPSARLALVDVAMSLGEIQREQFGDNKSARTTMLEAMPLVRSLLKDSPHSTRYKTPLATLLARIGHTYRDEDPREALAYYSEAAGLVEELSAADPADARMRRSVAIHATNVAHMLERVGRLREAETRYRSSLTIHSQMALADPASVQHRDDQAYVQGALGTLLIRQGRLAEGETELVQAAEVREGLLKSNPDNAIYRFRLMRIYLSMGEGRERSAHWSEARAAYVRSQELIQSLSGKMPVGDDLERAAKGIAVCDRHLAAR